MQRATTASKERKKTHRSSKQNASGEFTVQAKKADKKSFRFWS